MMKLGNGSIMLWGCFSSVGVRNCSGLRRICMEPNTGILDTMTDAGRQVIPGLILSSSCVTQLLIDISEES